MISEILIWFLEIFELFVFLHCFSKGRFCYFIGENAKLFLFVNSSRFPFVGEFLPDCNASQSFVDPFFWIAFQFVVFFDSVLRKFWVFYFLDSFIAYLRKPLFEWFCFWGGNGLDDAEHGFGICTICFSKFA